MAVPAFGAFAAAIDGEPIEPIWTDPKVSDRRDGLAALLEAAGTLQRTTPATTRVLEDAVLGRPDRWTFDDVIVPALLTAGGRSAPALRDVAANRLEARVAEPLTPPPDAMRSIAGLTCKCVDCAAARSFLIDPKLKQWMFRAAVGSRTHVEDALRRARADVDCRTEKRGSPHTLVCTKNTATYDRQVAQRKADLAALVALGRVG